MRWKNLIAAALAAIVVSGCASVAERIPSLRYCEKVSYERTGAKMLLKAECTLPVDAGVL